MPLPVADRHPSGSILAIGGELRVIALPQNSRTPSLVTVTTAAAVAVLATAITLTSTTPVLIDDNFDIPFSAGTITTTTGGWVIPALTTTAAVTANATSISVTAVSAYILPAGARATFGSVTVETTAATLIGTTATVVPIRAASGGIANAAVSVNTLAIRPAAVAVATTTASTAFLPLLSLLGIQSADAPNKTSLISIRSFQSGLGNEQRPVMVDFSMQMQGWVHQRDQAYLNVIEPAATQSLEVYAEYYSPRGTVRRGAAFIADSGINEKNDDVLKYTFTLGFQGIPTTSRF
jgi:hypothetical protein